MNSLPQKREIEENNYFINNLHLKRCVYLVSHLPQVKVRASNDEVRSMNFSSYKACVITIVYQCQADIVFSKSILKNQDDYDIYCHSTTNVR